MCESVTASVASSRQYLHKLCYVWNMEKISAHTQMNGQKEGLAAIMCLLKTCLWINDHKQLKYCLQFKTWKIVNCVTCTEIGYHLQRVFGVKITMQTLFLF